MNSIRFRMTAAALLLGAFALVQANPAAAFVRLTRQGPNGVVQAHWLDSELPLSSVINPTNSDIPYATALATVIQSGENWENVNTSYFTVNGHEFVGAPELPPALAVDGQHSVFFDIAGVNFAPGGGVIAFVRSSIDLATGHTVDADMVFNDRDFFSSVSTPNLTPAPAGQSSVDLEAVLTHEYGHYFSLDHTSVTGCTMIPFIQNNITQRTLELDDRAGLSTVYPESAARGLSPDGVDFHATTGKVSGTVVNGFNGTAIFGAHVEAINIAAPTAANSISAISGELTLRNGQGDYTIYGLPPGNYAIRIVPLDGVNTTATDGNIGGVFNGIDINFDVEFWNGANESANGFTDVAGQFDPVAVAGGATSGGINFITNTFPGRVIIAQHGQFENIVTFGNTGYLATRFDPPFEGPYTITSVNFPTFTFNGVPAGFLSAKLCPLNPATGGPDIANPLVNLTPFNGNPNGNNVVPINIAGVNGGTYFWVLQFPSQAIPGFPNNFPFLRMDFTALDQGLFANSYRITLGGAVSVLIDRNLAIAMTCQLPNPDDVPMVAPTGLGANRRSTQTDFSFVPSPNRRADGFDMPAHSLDQTMLIRRDLGWVDVDTTGAGNAAVHLSPSPAAAPATIWAVQSQDVNGHRSLQSAVTILGLAEDADEPNGKMNETPTVLTGTVTNRPATYAPAGDQDFYQVMAAPGDVIDASATATGQDGNNNMDLVMVLYDNTGDVVAINDDFSGLNPRIIFTVPTPDKGKSNVAKKYRIHVTDFRSSSLTAPVPQVRTPSTYNLSAKVTPPASLAARVGGRQINPDEFYFANSGPNPANPVAKFMLVIPKSAANSAVKLNIFDVKGRLVRTLMQGNLQAGPHTAIWDGKDRDGHGVASGTYFARITAGSWQQEARVTILK